MWDDLMSGALGDDIDLAYDVFNEELIQSFETLQTITTRGLSGSIQESHVEWLCNQFRPIGRYGW